MGELGKLLQELSELGVRIAVRDDQVMLDAPPGVLTAAMRGRLRASKQQIIAEIGRIRADEAGGCGVIGPDRSNDHVPFPLADLQLGFYLADDPYMEFHVRPHAYIEMEYDELDVPAYATAWNRVLERHRRELCVVTPSIELQLLHRYEPVRFHQYDLRGLGSHEVRARLAQLRAEMARCELPLDRWPWFDLRISTWREGGRCRSRVHYNHNNFFIDGLGTARLLDEIDECYRDPATVRPAPEISYRDAVLALERLASSPEGERARAYWLNRLDDLPAPPEIPQRSSVNRRRRSYLERRSGTLAASRWQAFKESAAACGVTPSSAVLAAYACVLSTWSNSDHFILSQMVTRRFASLHPQLPEMLGNFASLYPLEVRLDPAAAFARNAGSIQDQVLEDLKHLQLGGMRVLQELNRRRGSFGSAPSPFVVGSGLAMRRYRKTSFQVLETSQTLLDHQFFEPGDGSLYFVWDLIEDCFPAGLIDDMWDAFLRILHSLADVPDSWQRVNVDLLGKSAAACRLLPAAAQELPRTGWLHDALLEHAAASGERAVLIDGRGALSYAQLDEWSGRVASRLRARGIGPGCLVAIAMDRGRELLVATLAVLRSGAAYVPLDPALPTQRLRLILEDCGARLVLTEPHYRSTLSWPAAPDVWTVDSPAAGAAAWVPCGEPRQAAGELAYVIYTSGTTGTPKGVMIEHGAAYNSIADVNRRFAVGPCDRILGVSAFSFDLSVYDIFGALHAGACLVYPNAAAALDPQHWLELMERERITIWNSVPALMSLLAEAAQVRGIQLPQLRLVLLSGDRIPLSLPDAVRSIAPAAAVVSLGGATEASIWSVVYPVGARDPEWTTIPYGEPMSGQFWEVRDRHGQPCPRWVRGELYIGGKGLARGYLGDAARTNERFVSDSGSGERLYRTGDLGRYTTDGLLEWMGRADFQMKIQGHRVEPAEIEAALSAHPSIASAAVTVSESAGGRRLLVGNLACVPGVAAPQARELEDFLRNRLPAHMVPTAWRILPCLPTTANGKIDRRALMSARIEDSVPAAHANAYVPPTNEIERQLCSMWERALSVPRVGITDEFFALGGQSFDAIRMFAELKRTLGCEFTLNDIWVARTVRELARRVVSGEREQRGGCTAVAVNTAKGDPPLFLVHPAGGSALAYSPLGRKLQWPVYGLQVSADAELAATRRDFRLLARAHIANLRRIQPQGPYLVGGWSSGAAIAFEIAAQLEAAGEPVRRVFLLDGPPPVPGRVIGELERLAWFVQDLGGELPLERLAGVNLAGLDAQMRLRKALELVHIEAAAPILSSYTIFGDLLDAATRYSPGRVRADLMVVRVAQQVVAEFERHPAGAAPDWGWAAHTTGELRCERVPGTHYTFLNEAHVSRWSKLLILH